MGMIEDLGGGPVGKGFPAGWTVAAKPCDICKSAAALLFCRADSAFMCLACDSRVHATNDKLTSSRHEKVWMCEVCEQAPANVTCKADAAALCVTCDRDIHSANPLAQRHERTPIVPFYETAELVVKSMAMANINPSFQVQDTKISSCPGHGNNYSTTDHSWITSDTITNSKFNAEETPDLKSSMEFLLSGADPFLDFDYPISSLENHYNSGSDSVVPVQTMKPPPPMPTRSVVDHSPETRFEIDFTRSSINSYNINNSSSYAAQSLSHSVSSSSLDVGVVPDGSSISETSYPFGNLSGTASGNQAFASQLVGKDREARVLRYREKRKNRKFEKTIRYASRKAYAETRPRVKGRFAKRSSSSTTDIDCEIDQIFSSDSTGFCFSEARYGVVPSF